jgi:release factor glutamine methyltransferase
MHIAKRILKLLHPILGPLYLWYNSKKRKYKYGDIHVTVHPGVFHPGLFFSTKVLLRFLKQQAIKDKRILELGAGTGLISIFCYKLGAAKVTASDISTVAIGNLKENALKNNVTINVVHSDLFDHINPNEFDIIIINPPYYPRKIETEQHYPWYCGEQFEYFEKLFSQLKQKRTIPNTIYMILSEDCNIEHIRELGEKFSFTLNLISQEQALGEKNYIFNF